MSKGIFYANLKMSDGGLKIGLTTLKKQDLRKKCLVDASMGDFTIFIINSPD